MSKQTSKSSSNNKKSKASEDDELDAIIREMSILDQSKVLPASNEVLPPSLRLEPYEAVPIINMTSYAMTIMLNRYKASEPHLWAEFLRYTHSDLSSSAENRRQLVTLLEEMERKATPEMKNFVSAVDTVVQNAMGQLRAIELNQKKSPCPTELTQSLEALIDQSGGLIANMDYSMRDTIEKELRKLHKFALPASFLETICKAYFKLGFSVFYELLLSTKGRDLVTLPPDDYQKVMALQAYAASCAIFGGGWSRCPDSLLLKGMAFSFRGNYGEAVMDLNAAMKAKRKYGWMESSHKEVVVTMLRRCRQNLPPCLGNFVKLREDSDIADRYAAGYVQGTGASSHLLYVFGGIHPRQKPSPSTAKQVFDQFASSVNEMFSIGTIEPNEDPLNDLNVFDFRTETWQRIRVVGESPAPRGYCRLKMNEADGSLWLLGGRAGYNGSSGDLSDVWTFNLTTSKWRRVCSLPWHSSAEWHVMADVIFKSKWYIITIGSDGSPLETCVLDLKTVKFSTSPIDGPSPIILSREACSWFFNNKLFIYAVEDSRKVFGDENTKTARSIIWVLSFETASSSGGVRLKWMADPITCDRRMLKCPIRREYRGSIGMIFSETSCVLDGKNGRVFIYGGWHEDMYWHAADMAGNLTLLSGRYTAQCIEVNMNEGTIRTVEAASHIIGPGKRAMAIMGMYDNRILITGGYTTLDHNENLYEQIRTFRDEWMCSILPPEVDNVPVFADKETQELAGLQKLSPNMTVARTIQVSFPEILENALRAVLQDVKLRKFVQQFHPVGVYGAIAVKVCDEISTRPLRLDQVFVPENFVFMIPDEINLKWPLYKKMQPDNFNSLYVRDPITRFNVFYYVPMSEEQAKNYPVAMRDGYRTLVQIAYYGRWSPDMPNIFVTEEGARLRNAVEFSQDTPKAVQDPAQSLGIKLGDIYVDRCAYAQCPNFTKFIGYARTKTGDPPPKLQSCSRCKVVSYCSKQCQKSDWALHKAICKAATPLSSN